ncbi:MAG: hypothetical protein HQK53_03795 [Oligoflexia bacterium]|nr:hypothetical protein [Oligoflexia bacterium]
MKKVLAILALASFLTLPLASIALDTPATAPTDASAIDKAAAPTKHTTKHKKHHRKHKKGKCKGECNK